MKKGWEVKKLVEICNFERGLTYSKKDEVDYSSNIVLRANNVNVITNSLDFSELKYINDNIKVPQNKKVLKGSLIICTASGSKRHLGKVALIDSDYDYAFGGFMGQILPKPIVDSKFLFYALTSELYQNYINKLSDGVNINNLRFDDLSEYSFSLPPLPTQQRIVAILDKAFTAIAKAKENAERNLQNARELFESYLQSVFANSGEGWEEKKLGDKDLLEIIDGDRGKNYPKKNEYLIEGACLFLNTKNVRPDGFNFETTVFVNGERDRALGKGKLKRNDVVMTTRGTIGNIGLYDKTIGFDNIRINSGMLIFRPNRDVIISEYLFVILRSNIIKSQINKYVSGAAQPQLPIKTLVNFFIPVPKALPEQHAIVAKLDALAAETKKLEAIYQNKLADLEELKKSILQKAFNGELTEA